MSESFKTYPKSILCHNDLDYDTERQDRFGHNFKYLSQHISFKDKVLDEPLESIIIIDAVNEDDNEEKNDPNSTKKSKGIHPKKPHRKMQPKCCCTIQ